MQFVCDLRHPIHPKHCRGRGISEEKKNEGGCFTILLWSSAFLVISSKFGIDFHLGPKPSDLYGKYTWKIEKFSQVNKRELRSNAFEVGGYKWLDFLPWSFEFSLYFFSQFTSSLWLCLRICRAYKMAVHFIFLDSLQCCLHLLYCLRSYFSDLVPNVNSWPFSACTYGYKFWCHSMWYK